ncbi:MAG: DNA-binding protein WhiA [Christensenellaceae bacterium]|nr:DNA-binding protein WhiA [Christensenellaceae bacterium]
MSFSSDIKRELTGLRIKRESDALALLSAFTLSIGSLKLIPNLRQWGVHFVSENEAAVTLIAKLSAQYYGLECSISKVSHERLNAVYNELLLYGESVERFMLDTGIMSIDNDGDKTFSPRLPNDIADTETKSRAFLRGLFLACGTVTEPQKAYHAEFVFKNAEIADCANDLLMQFGINAKRTRRKASELVYIKDGEQLENLLALMGASSAMMAVTETRIIKQASNEANRSVNCINANLERVSKTALRQAGDIRLVIDTIGYDNLPEQLRMVAEARLNNYEMSLLELAEELGIGKSAVNYRLKRLSEMAEDIRIGVTPKIV